MKNAYRRPESALVVIYDCQCRVLVMQRQDDPDFWQSVTGTLEIGELAINTALREVKEETGIDIQQAGYYLYDHQQTNRYAIRDIWQHRYPPNTPFNTEHVFSLQVKSDEAITLTEHLAYQWLEKNAAMAKVWSDTNRAAIKDCVPDANMPT
ncbi:MAG: dihydroneopterin triphosphate diphosphatase [Alteromonadaceae bacterium]|uniref:Dihydroneopterin triphosphate diphosphatase n=1 Tax=Paraglaciecola mesophila TaxID=197222 RepID=A0ABU9T128_9ALTE|nr:dihydroneopterin triphosphate diphosphatase [Alteromonadaceae bacterium]MBB20605.1 dihydroneopterin triphosphate diphosphatase [Rickettsiales bacterium]